MWKDAHNASRLAVERVLQVAAEAAAGSHLGGYVVEIGPPVWDGNLESLTADGPPFSSYIAVSAKRSKALYWLLLGTPLNQSFLPCAPPTIHGLI